MSSAHPKKKRKQRYVRYITLLYITQPRFKSSVSAEKMFELWIWRIMSPLKSIILMSFYADRCAGHSLKSQLQGICSGHTVISDCYYLVYSSGKWLLFSFPFNKKLRYSHNKRNHQLSITPCYMDKVSL